uniref:Mucin-1 n=1 Tax=Sus scrofa TaxID=9823 RepID=A0A8D0Q2Q4_PIG
MSSPTTSPASGLVTTPVHVVPSNHSDTPTTLASHITRTIANSTNRSIVPPTSSHPKTSQQSSVMVSLIFLYFRITNLQFTSSLEDPSTSYYKDLQRRISELFLQVYKEDGLLGLFYIKFRPGSVLVELILAFQDSAAAHNLKTQFDRLKAEAGTYNLTISEVSVIDAPFPSSAQPGSGVPGWGIALLVLVCILVALAIIYVIALAVCQCRRKNCGQLDIFPTRDAYHPMSEYPTYHTHGRYVPPGSTKRNPYEQVSAGNGGGSLSYSNLAATSANL